MIVPWAICSHCQLVRAVRRDGRVRQHRFISFNGYSRGQECTGSGFLPTEYVMTARMSLREMQESDRTIIRNRQYDRLR